VFVSDRFFFFRALTMSLKGVIQGLDENGDPKQAVLSQAAAAAVERLINLMSEHQGARTSCRTAWPTCASTMISRARSRSQWTSRLRHFAEMIVSILLLHGYDPNSIDPAVLQVMHDWACRMRTPDPHCFIDALAAKLLTNPPMPTFSFTVQFVVRLTAIMLAAIGAVQGGRDTSLAAEAAFLQLPLHLPRAVGPTSALAAPPSLYPPPAPQFTTHARASCHDDEGLRDRHREQRSEQHTDADHRGPRSRSQHDRSPARGRSRSRDRHYSRHRRRSRTSSPSDRRRRRPCSRSSRSRSPRPTRAVRQPPNPILGPPSKFAAAQA